MTLYLVPPTQASLNNCVEIDDRQSRTIIISKFNEKTTVKDLSLRFSVYGSIKDCYLCLDPNGGRQANIIFNEVESAVRAIRDGAGNQIYLHDKKLTVRAKLDNGKEVILYLESHSGNTSINELNDDCLFEIFKYLSVKERFKLRKVSTRWCNIIIKSLLMLQYLDLENPRIYFLMNPEMYTSMYSLFVKNRIRFQKLFKILKNKELSLEESLSYIENSITKDLLFAVDNLKTHLLAMNCNGLKKLIVRRLSNNEEILNGIFTANQELRHIEFHQNRFITGESLIYLPENIHTFIIVGCYNLRLNNLCAVLKRLKNLKCLILDNWIEIDILNIFNGYCENLETLKLRFEQWEYIDIDSFLYITNLKYLKDLSINRGPKMMDIFLVELSKNCQHLSNLKLISFKYYMYHMQIGEIGMNAIAALSKLQILTIYNFPFLHGFNNLRGLRKLHCICTNIQEKQILTIIRNSPELKYLHIRCCPNVTINILSKLTVISTDRCNNVVLEVVFSGTGEHKRYIIHNGDVL